MTPSVTAEANQPTFPPPATLLPTESAIPSSNVLIPGYEVQSELGRGGMGVVYKARQTELQRIVALKMILAGSHVDEAGLARFRTEAEAIARLQHPNIVQIHEVGEHDGLPFFSLEFCPGGSLATRLQGTPMVPTEAARLVETLARAIQVVHARDILHRDLSPGNVLFTEEGNPKISDFGLARKLDSSVHTATGAIMGTPSYMAPEQASGKTHAIGPACDIYALGAILYECLTGRPPFKAATALDTLLQVIGEEPVSPRILNNQVPRDLETITLKCLHKEPTRRYVCAVDLAADLSRFQSGEPIVARPVGHLERGFKWVRRNAAVSTLAVAVVVALSVGLLAALWQRDRADTKAQEAEENLVLAQQEKRRAETQRDRAEGLVYAGKLALAQQAFQGGNAVRALQYLQETQPTLRGWEYHHLQTRFRSRQTFIAPTGFGYAIAVTPDGKRIASAGSYSEVRIRKADTGEEVLTLGGESENRAVNHLAFHPDGKRLASADSDRIVRVWDTEKGKELLTLKGHRDEVACVVFSSDGKRLVSGSRDGSVNVWDAENGIKLSSTPAHTKGVTCLAFSPDGKRFISGGQADGGGEWSWWDAEDAGFLGGVSTAHTGSVTSLAYSPDGKYLASAGTDHVVKVWDSDQGTLVLTLKGHVRPVSTVAFHPDGTRLLSSDGNEHSAVGEMKVWSADKGEELFSLQGHTGGVSGLCYSPDGRRIFSTSWDATIKVWDGDNGHEGMFFPGHLDVSSVAFSPDGTRLLVSGGDGAVRIWEAGSARLLREYLEGWAGEQASWHPDGKQIASGAWEGTVRIWDAITGKEHFTFRERGSVSRGVCFSPDGKWLVAARSWEPLRRHDPGEVKRWAVGNAQAEITLKGHAQGVCCVAVSPDSKRLASAGWDSVVKVWDIEKGQELISLRGHTQPVGCVAFSPDGKRIASASADLSVKVWDVDGANEVVTLVGHQGNVQGLAFSPDGKRLVSGDSEGAVKVWDTGLWLEVATLKGGSDGVRSVAFSPDGSRLALGGGQVVRIWESHGADVSRWAFPELAERMDYHASQAKRAEERKQWFAVAFHLGRLLIDQPNNGDLKRRRDEALKHHAEAK